MKVVNSLAQIYKQQAQINKKLRTQVDKLIIAVKEDKWHYVSRIKEDESFALKIETSRVEDPTKLEDFFACTIVVENTNAVKIAKRLIRKHFKIEYLRPKKDDFTSKDSYSFVFDDLRLYVKLRSTAARPKGPINDVIFEIQIKTFLQHAWSIATHDLVYKSDSISWTKQRVAYQVKAMLENAEVSIEKANKLKKLPGLPTSNYKVQFQNEIKEFILKHFVNSILPNDLVTLINNIEYISKKIFHMDLNEIEDCLIADTAKGRGTNTLNLSPFLIVLQSIINEKPKKVNAFMKRRSRGKYNPKLFLPKEIDTSKIDKNIVEDKIIRV